MKYIVVVLKKIIKGIGVIIKKLKLEKVCFKIIEFMNIKYPNALNNKEFITYLQNSKYTYNKQVLLNVQNYPIPEMTKLLNDNQNIRYLNITKDTYNIKELTSLQLEEILALTHSPTIIATSESRLLDLLNPKKEQKVVFIWHGCGVFKKFGKTAKEYTRRKPDYVIVSAEGLRSIFADTFDIPIENVLALGLPRTEYLLEEGICDKKKSYFHKKYAFLKSKKIYLYVPTFLESPYRCLTRFDLEEFSKLLAPDEILLYRLHPGIITALEKNTMSKKRCNFKEVGNNVVSMNAEETMDLLCISDVIITDYSSAFFEGLLLNKPCVFVADDIDTYERGLHIDYRKDLPGQVIETGKSADVLHAVRNATIDHPNYEKFKEYHLGACKGEITKRLSDFLKTLEK